MISYLEGSLFKKEEDRIILLVSHIGYEVVLPSFVMQTLSNKELGDEIFIYIYYHQTEKQPKPVLIGFNSELEKEFFQYFISVDAVGPMKAVKAMNIPISEIAGAIEKKDVSKLKNLKGIGARTAQKIIAALEGRVEKFILLKDSVDKEVSSFLSEDMVNQVIEVLAGQLGYKISDAKKLISKAIERNSSISTPEELLSEVIMDRKG